MLKEALEFLNSKFVAARQSVVISTPQVKHEFLLQDQNGELTWHEVQPDPRNHKARDLSAVIGFASANEKALVWYSRNGVVCVIDDETRRDKITLPLRQSPQIEALHKMEQSREPIDQSGLILLLRTTFASTVLPANFLSIIKTLKFNRQEDGEAEIDHGKASLGKNIKLGLTSGERIPEEIMFSVPVFTNGFQMRASVRAAVHIDAAEETFTVIPLPLEIEQAIVSAEVGIRAEIGDRVAAGKVFYGEPA